MNIHYLHVWGWSPPAHVLLILLFLFLTGMIYLIRSSGASLSVNLPVPPPPLPPSCVLQFVLLHCEPQQLVWNSHRAPSAGLWNAALVAVFFTACCAGQP